MRPTLRAARAAKSKGSSGVGTVEGAQQDDALAVGRAHAAQIGLAVGELAARQAPRGEAEVAAEAFGQTLGGREREQPSRHCGLTVRTSGLASA